VQLAEGTSSLCHRTELRHVGLTQMYFAMHAARKLSLQLDAVALGRSQRPSVRCCWEERPRLDCARTQAG